MIEESYFRDVFSALVKAIYYERGRGSYFRVTRVGTDYIEPKAIKGRTRQEIIDSCVAELLRGKIIQSATCSAKEGNGHVLDFEIKGCVHLPVEARLQEEGVPPFVCPPINIILHKIRQLTDVPVETAEIEVDHRAGKCAIRVVTLEGVLGEKG